MEDSFEELSINIFGILTYKSCLQRLTGVNLAKIYYLVVSQELHILWIKIYIGIIVSFVISLPMQDM